MKKFCLHIFTLFIVLSVLLPVNGYAVRYDPANEQQVLDYLRDEMGLNNAVTAGIMANIESESNFDPEAGVLDVNGLNSYGICQWNGARLVNMIAFCEERDLDYTKVEGQLAFLNHELNHGEWYAFSKVKDLPDTLEGAYTAGYNWAKYFERCAAEWNGIDMYDARGKRAEKRYLAMPQEDPVPTVQITFDAKGGACSVGTATIKIGDPIGTLPVPTRAGFEFVGWFNYEDRQVTEASVFTANETLFAGWKEIVVTEKLVFTDVAADAYYYDAVAWALKQGVTGGTSATNFSPEDYCTRAQIVTFLWRANGSPEPQSLGERFADVPAGAYYEKAVAWAAERGITSGTGNGVFSPDAPCTRAQIVTFLWRSCGSKTPSDYSNPFTDVSAGDYFYVPVLWARENKITIGVSESMFGSEQTCTRAQSVVFLYRSLTEN